jgi:hypothetical protein
MMLLFMVILMMIMAMRRLILQTDEHVADERLRWGSDDVAVKVLRKRAAFFSVSRACIQNN